MQALFFSDLNTSDLNISDLSMRENWERSEPIVNLDLESLTELIQPIFKGQTVIAARPTVGGLANTNYKLELSKQSQPVLLRFNWKVMSKLLDLLA